VKAIGQQRSAFSIAEILPIWSNPVVVRDLRVSLRGARSFVGLGAYLGLLLILTLCSYAFAVHKPAGNVPDPVAAQSELQSFYSFIFATLATLVTLIAPALTAISIISEKQRLTFDLLVTTPMTAMQLLLGKLTSSVAFLGLLLALSVPASAMCILLGGSTIGDVLRIYFNLALSGVVMAAIGLLASCSSRNFVQALATAYASVFFFDFGTAAIGAIALASGRLMGGPALSSPIIYAVAVLNPFFAMAGSPPNVDIMGFSLLTVAALRTAMFGPRLTASLRRQILLLSFLVVLATTFLLESSIVRLRGVLLLAMISTVVFIAGSFFMPGLLVPCIDEDDPAGQVVRGRYSIREAFDGAHAGALPFLHIWLLVVISGVLAGIWISGASLLPGTIVVGHTTGSLIVGALCVAAYLSGLGFLMWSVARLMFWMTGSARSSRPLTFFVCVFLTVLPLAIMLVWAQATQGHFNPFNCKVALFWLLYPFTKVAWPSSTIQWTSFLGTGLYAYVLGTVIFPCWRDYTPVRAARSRAPRSSGTNQ
jgi:hypothetical protein